MITELFVPRYFPYLNVHIKVVYELEPWWEDTRSRALRQMPREDEFKLINLLQTVQQAGAKGKYAPVKGMIVYTKRQ